ncbi:MAG: inositol monophosphatase [Acidimicrobiaceae bacterium]|nr:inositol monophosphatase [Acidimicrobiaceae bacterium]
MAQDLLTTLNAAVDAVVVALAGCRDWGPTGLKHGQFGFDLAADVAATEVLQQAGLRVLSEESGLEHGDGPVAVLDPVDGSTNASRGIRYFATSICVVNEREPLAAVVHDHGSGERFEALRGGGARCDGETLQPPEPRPLAECVVGINGWPPGRGGWAQYRTLGAAALELCAVAAGRLDGYLDFSVSGLGSWDYLGALLVCAEAGVEVHDGHGRDLVVLDHQSRRTPVAAPSPLVDELMAVWDRLSGDTAAG